MVNREQYLQTKDWAAKFEASARQLEYGESDMHPLLKETYIAAYRSEAMNLREQCTAYTGQPVTTLGDVLHEEEMADPDFNRQYMMEVKKLHDELAAMELHAETLAG